MRLRIYTLLISCMMATTYSFADVNTSSNSASTAGALAGAGASLNLDQSAHDSGNVVSHASDLSNMVPQVTAPGLATTLTETCMGSTSAGAAGAGFGFSFGTTWRDSACVRRLDSRQMSAFGDIATAREMMCDSELVREAAVRAGRPCVADGGQPMVTTVSIEQRQIVPTEEAATPVVEQRVRE